jgi:hypothetical protein
VTSHSLAELGAKRPLCWSCEVRRAALGKLEPLCRRCTDWTIGGKRWFMKGRMRGRYPFRGHKSWVREPALPLDRWLFAMKRIDALIRRVNAEHLADAVEKRIEEIAA